MAGLWHPAGALCAVGGAFGDFVFGGDLFAVFLVNALVDHPAALAVRAAHTRSNSILVFAAVHENQAHTVGGGARLVDGRDFIVAEHRVGAFYWERPLRVLHTEVIDFLCLVAGIDEGEVYQHLLAVVPLELQVHYVYDLAEACGLAVGYILGCTVIAPGADSPIEACFLHVHAAGQELRPGRKLEHFKLRLTFLYEVGTGFELRILPRLGEPGVGEVVQLVGVVLGLHKLPGDFRESSEGAV